MLIEILDVRYWSMWMQEKCQAINVVLPPAGYGCLLGLAVVEGAPLVKSPQSSRIGVSPENPQPETPPAQKPDEEAKPKKYDGFYKPWDQFTEKKKLTSGIPSLDVDSEGRPAHVIRKNTEGLISRYVLVQSRSFEALTVNLYRPD